VREPGRKEQSEEQRAGGHKPSSLRAVADALRSVPERMKRPESLLMLLAIMASLGAHMPPYLGLGALADYFEEQEKQKPKEALPPISFEVLDEKAAEPPKPEEPPPEPAKLAKEKPERPKKQKPEPPKAKQEPKKQVVELVPQKPALTPPPEPLKEARKQSVTQKSEDPNVEPPPDAKYLAEENQRVEEESVASVTSETKNDPTPQASAPKAPGEEKSGDSREQERGAEQGSKTEQQQQLASRERRQQATPRPPAPAQPPPSAQAPARPTPPAPAQQAPSAPAPAETVIRDPLGSFVLAPQSPSAARSNATRQPSGAPGKQPNIKVSWSAFEQTFGAEQLAQDRMPREAKRRGAGREKRWEEFRAAIENYVVGVKPGNQTKLNAAADPFAAYLAAFHRNLHMEFAHDFLASLPMAGDLGNPELVTTVEIVINADGSLDRVGVVRPSGNLMYDFGAFNAVQRGAPYPPTPEKIRSPDGRVYIKWALHRNESQCGTWNAEAFILKNPPRSPNDPKQDNVSPFRPGVPSGSDTEQGTNEPRRPPSKAPAIEPGETLGQRTPRATRAHG
jgi:TonB family protein